MSGLVRLAFLPFLLAAPMLAQRMAATYPNMQAFLDSCPQNDPYLPIIRRDFQILRDAAPIGDISCVEPFSQMPPAQVTDELSTIQTLRFMYYMDMGRSVYLPWTQLRLYDWVKSRVSGVNISSALAGGECCSSIGARTYINVGSLAAAAADNTTVAVQAQYRQTPRGQAANVAFYAHEARHTEGNGYPHVTGCPAFPSNGVFGCDPSYDETNLFPYAIQFYLTKQMLTGGINLGYSCDAATRGTLAAGFQSDANSFISRFLTNAPASLNVPAANAGGPCIPAATFTVGPLPPQLNGSAPTLIVSVSASDATAGWTADSANSWITPVSGANSLGSGQAVFSVDPSAGSGQSGSVIVAGSVIWISCGTVCTVSTLPPSVIVFNPISSVFLGSAPFAISATATAGLPVVLTSNTPAVCTVSGSTLSIDGPGTCSIIASQAGNASYSQAAPVTRTFTVLTQYPQTISFAAPPNMVLGASPQPLSAVASSALSVAFSSASPTVCTVSGARVTAVSAGNCSITAAQTGNATFSAAPPAVQSFPIIKPSQTIWTLNATFSDRGTLGGYLVVDAAIPAYSNWDIATSGGNSAVFPPFEFKPATSGLGSNTNAAAVGATAFVSATAGPSGTSGNRILWLDPTSPLVNATGAVAVAPGNFSVDCYGVCLPPNRPISSGALRPGYFLPFIAPGGVIPVGGSTPTLQPGGWASIYGSNFAPSMAVWNGDFPTSLGGVGVTVDGTPAYLSFVSPTQINFQAPDDSVIGPVPVVVSTSKGTFSSTVNLATVAPTFVLSDSSHVVGVILRQDGSGYYGGAYDLLGPTGNSLGYVTVAAAPGDIVEMFATGFGPTTPHVSAGQPFAGFAPSTLPVALTINGVSVTPLSVGLSSAGLYQINLILPAGLGTGDVSIVAVVLGARTPANAVISLR